MKSYYDFMFSVPCALHSRIQVCDTKIGRPKKIAGNLSDPNNSGNSARPRKIAKKICQPRKIGFGQISNPKNRTSIPVKMLTCAPLGPFCAIYFVSQ